MWQYIPKNSIVIEPQNLIAGVFALVLIATLFYFFAADRDSEGNYLGPSKFSEFLEKRKK